ncbi:hypothetical protein [Tropicibacter sp. S64]|uniref:hypothetical protein n=1 Tax=Tropicibacter sp. S64 TaxID=3415122 RepID=UPI003C79C2D4
MTRPFALLTLLLLGPASGAYAQVLEASSDATIRNRLCLGGSCADDPSPNFVADVDGTGLELRDFRGRIDYIDASTSSFPNTNWGIEFNEPSLSIAGGGLEYFAISDESAGTVPFLIRGGAPTNAFYLAANGDLGLGTSLPQKNLHIVEAGEAAIRFQDTGGVPYTWDLRGNEGGFYIYDVTQSTIPFEVRGNVPTRSFVLEENTGNLGLGLPSPVAPLHIQRDDGSASVVVENTAASPAAPREMFKMSNNGGSYFTLANTASGKDWYFVHENAAAGRFFVNHSSGGRQMALDPAGNMTIEGQLFTAGSCSAGCDRVFDADYPLPTIAEQAAMIREMKHLPNVGPTPEDGPFNLTAMTGGMLNELEKAHLYIEQLHGALQAQGEDLAEQKRLNAALLERINRIEAALSLQ